MNFTMRALKTRPSGLHLAFQPMMQWTLELVATQTF